MVNTVVSWLKFFAKFAFAFLIIGYMVYSGRLDLQVVKSGFMNPYVVFGSLSLVIFGTLIGFFRWRMLMAGQGVPLTIWQAMRYGFIGMFFNTTMPGIVSGDVVKAWYVIADRPKGQKKTPILTAIIIDRLIGLFGLITVSMLAMLFHWDVVWGSKQLHSIAIANLLMAGGVAFFFLLVTVSNWGPFAWMRTKLSAAGGGGSKLGAIVLKAYDAWASYRNSPKILWGSLAISAATHSCVVLSILFCARALGEAQMQVYQIFLLAPIGLLTIALPIAPAGLGVGHVAFNALFLSVGSKLGAEIFTLFVTLQVLVNLSGVFFYIRSPRPTPEPAMS